MSRSKKQRLLKAKRRRLSKAQPTQRETGSSPTKASRFFRPALFWKILWSWPSKLIVGASVILSVLAYWPKISVTAPAPVSVKDAFQYAFLIKNDWLFPIRDVHFSYAFKNVEGIATLTPEIVNQRTRIIGDIRVTSPDDIKPISVLNKDESTSLIFPRRFLDEYSYCDVEIFVTYRPVLWFWTKSDPFRFATRKEGTTLIWFPKAQSEPVEYHADPMKYLTITPGKGVDPAKTTLNLNR